MENNFGEFFRQKRQEKKLTQKSLAKLLYVSESAVSKWEKNVAHPDIIMLPKLCKILDVTEHELITACEDNQSRNEKIQAKRWRVFSMSWSLFFYIAYAVALIPCFICDLAINKGLTWFWIVLSALLLSFTFTNLPKLIKKHKLILLPLSMFLSLCLLLGVCCIYAGGDWFFVAAISVLLGLIIIFMPIFISKFKVFDNIKKFNDFVSIGIDFMMLNILLIVVYLYTKLNGYAIYNWYLKIALPITIVIYAIVNILICVKFLKVNKLLKTSIVLFLIDLFVYIPPLFIKVNNSFVQSEIIDDTNVLNADFLVWNEVSIDNNIHCIIFLTLMLLSVAFVVFGLFRHKRKKSNN